MLCVDTKVLLLMEEGGFLQTGMQLVEPTVSLLLLLLQPPILLLILLLLLLLVLLSVLLVLLVLLVLRYQVGSVQSYSTTVSSSSSS